ncbi:MAG: DUF4332 domain-containing protein [Clostridiales bacterium]|nr:DUF4332 domain-containing protein [Clostridiales bacterium]
MSYYRDLKQISIEDFKEILIDMDMIPSWMILKENINEQMDAIIDQGVSNLDELIISLKTKKKVEHFSEKSGMALDYLIVLRRMINGYLPKPNKFSDSTLFNEEVLNKLPYTTTKSLYDWIITPEQRENLSLETGILLDDILLLSKYSDVSRIRWVNHTFATVLLLTGYDSVEIIAASDYHTMYDTIKSWNEREKFYKAVISQKDMKRLVLLAKELDFDIEYQEVKDV